MWGCLHYELTLHEVCMKSACSHLQTLWIVDLKRHCHSELRGYALIKSVNLQVLDKPVIWIQPRKPLRTTEADCDQINKPTERHTSWPHRRASVFCNLVTLTYFFSSKIYNSSILREAFTGKARTVFEAIDVTFMRLITPLSFSFPVHCSTRWAFPSFSGPFSAVLSTRHGGKCQPMTFSSVKGTSVHLLCSSQLSDHLPSPVWASLPYVRRPTDKWTLCETNTKRALRSSRRRRAREGKGQN